MIPLDFMAIVNETSRYSSRACTTKPCWLVNTVLSIFETECLKNSCVQHAQTYWGPSDVCLMKILNFLPISLTWMCSEVGNTVAWLKCDADGIVLSFDLIWPFSKDARYCILASVFWQRLNKRFRDGSCGRGIEQIFLFKTIFGFFGVTSTLCKSNCFIYSKAIEKQGRFFS